MPKACEFCHNKKIRCEFDSASEVCSNCHSAGVECMYVVEADQVRFPANFVSPHIRKRKRHNVTNSEPTVRTSKTSNNHIPETTTYSQPHASDLTKLQAMSCGTPEASFLGRSRYLTDNAEIDEEDAGQYPEIYFNDSFQALSQVVNNHVQSLALPQGSARSSLIRSFLAHCQPWIPCLDATSITEIREEPSLILSAALVAGSRASNAPHASEVGERCYQKAKAMIHYRVHCFMHIVISSIYLQWWNPYGPEHVSLDNSCFWLRSGVALAFQLGLHREPPRHAADAALRRRTWWTLVSRDNQIATSHGRPRAICLQDSNVRPLTINDFAATNKDAELFMFYVRITSILGDLTEQLRRGTLSEHGKIEIENALLKWIDDLPTSLHLHERGSKTLNSYNVKVHQLHLPYFAAIILLCRPEQRSKPPTPSSIVAASYIIGIFDDIVASGDTHCFYPANTFYFKVAALLQISCHRYKQFASVVEEEQKVIRTILNELQKRFHAAIGAQRLVESMIRRCQTLSTEVHVSTKVPHEQSKFFAHFGPDLCQVWDEFVTGSSEETHNLHDHALDSRSFDINASTEIYRFDMPDSIDLSGAPFLDDLSNYWWWSDLTLS